MYACRLSVGRGRGVRMRFRLTVRVEFMVRTRV